MYVCIYVCMYELSPTWRLELFSMYVCMHVYVPMCLYVCMSEHNPISTVAQIQAYMYICMYVCTYACMYVI
jgi:hypothetical protein